MTRDKNPPKKERVLHTRVSEKLDADLRDRAADLGVSVSNLVRNILTHTIGMVDDIVADTTSVARVVKGQGGGDRQEVQMGHYSFTPDEPEPRSGAILGWQELILNVNAVCDTCNAILPRGTRGAAAVRDGAGPTVFLCCQCLAAVSGDDNDETP